MSSTGAIEMETEGAISKIESMRSGGMALATREYSPWNEIKYSFSFPQIATVPTPSNRLRGPCSPNATTLLLSSEPPPMGFFLFSARAPLPSSPDAVGNDDVEDEDDVAYGSTMGSTRFFCGPTAAFLYRFRLFPPASYVHANCNRTQRAHSSFRSNGSCFKHFRFPLRHLSQAYFAVEGRCRT